MTTSYDVETTGTGSGMPGRDADGLRTWNPSVGLYHKPAKKKRESYGGVIAALQDEMVRSGAIVKAYPENFAGIIAAIQDLTASEYRPGSDAGEKPPGGEVIIDPNTGLPIWIEGDTQNGQLWFDTRQGRLFVWVDDDWYQTNGADGIPIVTDSSVPPDLENVIPGQFWWDRAGQILYIFDGTYILPNGSTTTDPNAGGSPIWRLVNDASSDGLMQTTLTLPLAVMGPRVTALEDYEYLPNIDLSPTDDGKLPMSVQKDYNEWIFDALISLNNGLEEFQSVIVGETPPATDDPDNPIAAGQLWYDTEALELSIWYVDPDGDGQWVPTGVAHTYDADLAVIRASVAAESRQRNFEIHSINERLNNIDITDAEEITEINNRLNELQAEVNAIPTVDLDPYVRQVTFDNTQLDIYAKLAALVNKPAEYTQAMADVTERQLQAAIDTKATIDALAAVEASIPNVSSYTTQADIDASISQLSTDFLPRTGGTLSGSFIVEKTDVALPGFDFSNAFWYGKDAFKFAANGGNSDYSTFGVTEKPWEYAWNFSSKEDFCWIYNDTNKVFSITKEGPACSTLVLGDFADNTNNGRVIHNKIDVKERLNTYKTAFEQMRQGVANATDFDSLRANILSALATV